MIIIIIIIIIIIVIVINNNINNNNNCLLHCNDAEDSIDGQWKYHSKGYSGLIQGDDND